MLPQGGLAAMRLVSLVFCVAALAAGVAFPIVVAASGSQFWSPVRVLLYGVAPVMVGAVSLFAIWYGDSARKQLLAYGLAVGIAFVGADIYLDHRIRSTPWPAASIRVLSYPELRREGIRAFPHVCGVHFDLRSPALRIGGVPVQPVTGLSRNLITFYERDRAAWRFTDEHGFNNPAGQWDTPAALVLGDSFAFGAEVPVGKGFVDRLRERIGRTVNLGCSGNGPLLELAALAEYGPIVRPPVVVWAYYEGNDLSGDLPNEMQSPILPRYLTAGFTQDLFRKAPELEPAIIAFLLDAETKAASMRGGKLNMAALPSLNLDHLTLANLRRALGISHRYRTETLSQFGAVLKRAKAIAAEWGGEVVFVYLPDEGRYSGPLGAWDAAAYGRPVLELVEAVGIRVIDVAAVFARRPQPRSLFQSHYTEEGYRLVGDIIADELARR